MIGIEETKEQREATLPQPRAPRRWIIPKDIKCCPHACMGYGVQNARTKVTDAVLGAYERVCKDCGRQEAGYLDSFKSRRPCKRCGDFHDFTVKLWPEAAGKPALVEHCSEICSICQLEASAVSHFSTAQAFFARASKLRAKMKARKAREGEEEQRREARPAGVTS